MKELNKTEWKVFFVIIISIIIDNINGILLMNDVDLLISIGQIYRYFMIVFFLYYIVTNKQQKILIRLIVSVIYLTLLALMYFIEHKAIEGLTMDLTYGIKLIFPFIIIASLYTLSKNKEINSNLIEQIMKVLSILVPLTMIIPVILGIGYNAYDLGGYKGFYFSNNEINVVLICTFIYSIDKLYNNKKIKDIIITLINAGALFLIGSKTSIIVIAVVAIIYIIKLRKDKKWFIGTIIVALISIVVGSIIFSNQIDEMMHRFNYFYKTLTKKGGILTFLMSERNIRIAPAFQKNILAVNPLQGIINFIFGIGRYQQVDPSVLRTLMELDLFDTFYWYGFITAFIVLKEYLSFFIKSLQLKELFKYKLMFLTVFAFSMIAGHVWYSALAGQSLALICSTFLIKKNEIEEK